MCGIYGSIESSSRAPERVHEGLRKLEYRGPDSWGLVYPEPSGSLTVSKRTGRIRMGNRVWSLKRRNSIFA